MKKQSIFALAGLLASFITAPAFANIADIRAADHAVDFQLGYGSFNYAESIDNTTFDTEKGWLPSGELGYTWLHPEDKSIYSNLYFHADVVAQIGGVHYDGGVQVSNGFTVTDYPFTTNTDEQIYHITTKLGRFFALSSDAAITPYLDLGFRGWQRSINGGTYNQGGTPAMVGSSTETYSHFEGGAGFLLQYSPISSLVLSAGGQVGSTFAATLRGGGLNYNLGSRPVWQAAGSLGYSITPSFELIGSARYDGFGYNKSSVQFNSFEPDSYTHQLTIMGGLAYHLK